MSRVLCSSISRLVPNYLRTFEIIKTLCNVNHEQCNTFPVPEEDGGVTQKYLFRDYSVDCSSNRYNVYVVYAIVMILVYPIGSKLFIYILKYIHFRSALIF